MSVFQQDPYSSLEKRSVAISKPLLKLTAIPNDISFQNDGTYRSLLEKRRNTYKNTLTKFDEDLASFYPSPALDYRPSKVPPSFSEAEEHRIAHKVHPYYIQKPGDTICKSTGIVVTKKQLKLGCDISQMYHLGPVIPMYFLFIKQASSVICLLCIIALIAILQQSFADFFNYRSFIANMAEDGTQLSVLMGLTMFIVVLLFPLLHLFRRKQKLTKLACKKTVITPYDYTIMCSGMGRIHIEDEVRKFFTDCIVPGYSLDVVQVAITYNIERYVSEIRELKKAMEDNKRSGGDPHTTEHLNKKINELNNLLSTNKLKLEKCFGLKRNGLAFVTFNTKQEAKTARRKFEMSALESLTIQGLQAMTEDYSQYFFKQHFVKIEKAPDLHEIIWENLDCNNTDRILSIMSILSIFGIICGTTLILYFFRAIDAFDHPFLLGLSVAIINEAISYTVLSFTLKDKIKTITKLQIAIGTKTALAQFLNSVIPIFIVHVVIPTTTIEAFSHDVLVIAAFTFFLPAIIRIINPEHIIKTNIRKGLLAQGNQCQLTQEQLNHAFEDGSLKVHHLYVDCGRVLLFSCLYFAISPGVAFVGFIALIVVYWVDKYNLLRRTLLPPSIRSEVAEAMFEFADLAVFLLALGCYCSTFFHSSGEEDSPMEHVSDIIIFLSFVVLAFSVIYIFLPNKRLNRLWFTKKRHDFSPWINEFLYQQANDYFYGDYLSLNPVFRDKPIPESLRDTYAETAEEYQKIELLKNLPELLPIFDYATHRPSLYQIWKEHLDGLQDPYYSFPQNYGYGLQFLDPTFGQAPPKATVAAVKKSSAAVRRPRGVSDNNPTWANAPVHEERKFSFQYTHSHNKEEEKEPPINFDNKISIVNDDGVSRFGTHIGGSMFREWGAFMDPNLKSIGDITLPDATPRDTLAFLRENIDPDTRPQDWPDTSILKSPVLDTRSLRLDASPIAKDFWLTERKNNK